MRTVVLAMLAMLSAVTVVVAQEVNRRDPAAVAKAYLEACDRWDLEAAAQFMRLPGEVESLRTLLERQGQPMVEQIIGEALCAPLTRHVSHVTGQAAVTGDECRVQAIATYSLPTTLVLRRQEEGTWDVLLAESMSATTGAEEAIVLRNVGLGSSVATDGQTACQSNLKQLMLAILMYAQDHDEVLPPAETWRDDLMPYCRNAPSFVCPVNPWGYTYNTTLSKKPLGQIANPAEAIVLFEVGHVEPNMAADLTKVKLAHRHNGGDDFAYADGHVKWLSGQ